MSRKLYCLGLKDNGRGRRVNKCIFHTNDNRITPMLMHIWLTAAIRCGFELSETLSASGCCCRCCSFTTETDRSWCSHELVVNAEDWYSLLLLLLMAYSCWALPCPPLIVRSPDWLPSSMQTRGWYSVASNPPQLHVARYSLVWV